MKILILLTKWPGGVGGGVKNIRKELEKDGHYVEAFSREEDLKISSFKGSISPIRKFVKKKIIQEKFDIVYTQDWSMAFPLIFPTPIFKKKHFCMFHGNQYGKTRILQNIVGKVMGQHLLCMAPSLKRRFPKANMNYCGVNLDQFKKTKNKRVYLGWIEKTTETLKKEDLEKISKMLNVPLLIAKGLKHEEMNDKFYSKCKIFVSLPPHSAGFQASWLEAMAAGVPVIIGNENGAGEIQPFEKIQKKSFEEIIRAIKNHPKRDYLTWIKENDFTWKRHAKALVRIFSKAS